MLPTFESWSFLQTELISLRPLPGSSQVSQEGGGASAAEQVQAVKPVQAWNGFSVRLQPGKAQSGWSRCVLTRNVFWGEEQQTGLSPCELTIKKLCLKDKTKPRLQPEMETF